MLHFVMDRNMRHVPELKKKLCCTFITDLRRIIVIKNTQTNTKRHFILIAVNKIEFKNFVLTSRLVKFQCDMRVHAQGVVIVNDT